MLTRLLPSLIFIFGVAISSASDLFFPKILTNDQIVHHTGYTLSYNENHEQANWIAYKITASQILGPSYKRTNDFRPDPDVSTGSASPADYKGSGYDRGHLAPASTMGYSAITISESFYMSNMSPQNPSFNRGVWKKLEEQVRRWAVDNEEIYVVTAPVLSGTLRSIGSNRVSVPQYYVKALLDFYEPEIKGIGFVMANQGSRAELQSFAVTIDSVESITGLDLFVALPDSIEDEIEGSLELGKWSFADPKKYKKSSVSSVSSVVQCKGITKAGNRCKRMTKNESGYCWQHEK